MHSILPPIDELDSQLSGFELHELLSSDEFSATFQATHTSLAREVSLKILPPSVAANPAFKEAFLAQARSLAKLNHTNLISVFDVGEENGYIFIEMESLEGQSLASLLAEQSFTETEIATIVRGIGAGLQHAHDAGVHHRQLSENDISLDAKGHPILSGFSPSQGRSDASADLAADMKSTGRLIHILLTGYDLPEPGQPVQPSTLAEISQDWDLIVQDMMPGGRFTDYTDLIAALGPFLASGSNTQAPLRTASPGTTTRPSTRPNKAQLNQATETAKASSTLTRNLVIIALLLGAVFFVFEKYKVKEAAVTAREKENAALRKEKQTKPLPHRQAQTKPAPQQVDTLKPNTPMPEIVQTFSLEELKDALADGQRRQFPKGSIDHGNSVYYFISESLGWSDARAEAARYGAFIACPPDRKTLNAIRRLIPDGETVWLGGGIAAGTWAWMDQRPFKYSVKTGDSSLRLACTAAGTLVGRPRGNSYPLLLQWRKDGTLPSDAAIPETDRSSGHYPIGTFEQGGRYYYVSGETMPWEQASKTSKDAGGHLAVAATSDEFNSLRSTARAALASGEECWIGGRTTDGAWAWHTYEPWDGGDWLKGKEPVAAHKFHTTYTIQDSADGWAASDGTLKKRFMVEWSSDAADTLPNSDDLKQLLEGIQTNSRQQLQTITTKRNKLLRENADLYVKQMRLIPRQYGSKKRVGIEKIVGTMISLSKDGRVTKRRPNLNPPEKITRIYDFHRRKQASLKASAREAIEKIRNDHITAIKNAFTSPDPNTQGVLKEELNASSDTERFEKHLFP